MLIFWRIF